MIPRTIHYCWFGRGTKPDLAVKCINSWKKKCPDYDIVEWNEDNFDISNCPLYVRQAYETKKWAFVTDYVRLKVVYDHGGIYFDTDVELRKNLDTLLKYRGFFGFEDGKCINTGLGFGAVKGLSLLRELMQDYDNLAFVQEDGTYDRMPCPERNTKIFLRNGLRQDDSLQMLENGIRILPSVYMCPINYISGKRKWSVKTMSIHWYSESWKSIRDKKEMEEYRLLLERIKVQKRKQSCAEMKDFIFHVPNRMMRWLIGERGYEKLKSNLKRREE